MVTHDQELQIEWFIDEDPIEEDDAIHFVNLPPSYKLKIDSLLEEDEGEYSCILTNLATKESITSACMLTVKAKKIKPQFITPLESGETDVGDFIEFRALVKGTPKPAATWYFKEQKLELSDKYDFGQEDDEYYLIVDDCKPSDTGEYKLIIENSEGQESCSVNLDVIGEVEQVEDTSAPTLVLSEESQDKIEKVEGEEIVLSVNCHCKTDPEVSWFKNGDKITSTSNIEMKNEDNFIRLVIKKSSPDDSGMYTCVAENEFGRSQVSVNMHIKGNKNINVLFTLNLFFCIVCFYPISTHMCLFKYCVCLLKKFCIV